MKILIVTKNWLGDILFQVPAIEAIRRGHRDAEIVCLAPARCREILENHPAVDRFMVFDEKNEHRSLLARLGLLIRLRKESWDKAYLLHRSKSRALMMVLAGVRERIGYGRGRSWLLTHPVLEPGKVLHHVDYFLHLTEAAGCPKPDQSVYHFYFSREEDEAVRVFLQNHGLAAGRYVCFHLGANWEPKRWPVRNFAALAEKIKECADLPVVVTGSRDDRWLAEGMMKEVRHARVICAAGETSLGMLGALFKKSAWVVSGDSGPMHIAAGVGARLVALFGPTDPKLTGPRGAGESVVLSYVPPGYHIPWYGEDLPPEGWLTHITPDEVAGAMAARGWPAAGDQAPVLPEKIFPRIQCPRGKDMNLLVVSLSNIGDVILTTPVLTALCEKFPGARLTVVVGPRAREVLIRSPRIDRIVVYDKRAGLWGQWNFLRSLHGVFYDLVIDLRNTAIPFLVFSRRRSPLFRQFKRISMRERHLEVLQMTGITVPKTSAGFCFFDARDVSSLRVKLERLGVKAPQNWIVVAAGARSSAKRWPAAKFRELLGDLAQATDKELVLAGDASERDLGETLRGAAPSRIFNLAGHTTLPETAALVSQSALLITNDSALMHYGYELDRPVVSLFGPTDELKYGREGDHFRLIKAAEAGLESLEVGRVFSACLELLSRYEDKASVAVR